jgi:hypothetical protein
VLHRVRGAQPRLQVLPHLGDHVGDHRLDQVVLGREVVGDHPLLTPARRATSATEARGHAVCVSRWREVQARARPSAELMTPAVEIVKR